ncbi:MAG TPA: allophanate hydrolase, partial [Bradyrhizobium sp.]|nr:allophanate hydrolase [Bradyrhizobium sp.]
YLRDAMCLFNPGDIVKWKPITREAYDQALADVEAGKFAPLMRDVTFSLDEFQQDIDGYNRKLDGVLHGH